jgi:hypothetical protein
LTQVEFGRNPKFQAEIFIFDEKVLFGQFYYIFGHPHWSGEVDKNTNNLCFRVFGNAPV